MGVDYELRVSSPDGSSRLFATRTFLEVGNSPGLNYVLSVGQVGALTVTLPPEYNTLLPKDAQVGVWRSVNGRPAQLEGGSVYLIRKWDYAENYTVVTAVHANHIMSARCMLYGLSSGYGVIAVASPADDIIKDLWRLNFTGSIDSTLRALTTGIVGGDNTDADISATVSVEADESLAPTTYKTIAWRNLLDIIVEIGKASYELGTYLATEIVAVGSGLQLQTFVGQRGSDRRFGGGNTLLFSAARGNLQNSLLTVDAINEVTFAEAGGAGISTGKRYTATASDTTRMAETPFARREIFVDDSNNQDVNALTDMAKAAVLAGRPIITASGDLVETDACIRGIHYDFGDLVTVEVAGKRYDMHLDMLEVSVRGGQDSTTSSFGAETLGAGGATGRYQPPAYHPTPVPAPPRQQRGGGTGPTHPPDDFPAGDSPFPRDRTIGHFIYHG